LESSLSLTYPSRFLIVSRARFNSCIISSLSRSSYKAQSQNALTVLSYLLVRHLNIGYRLLELPVNFFEIQFILVEQLIFEVIFLRNRDLFIAFGSEIPPFADP
jgi:hypothetical protein